MDPDYTPLDEMGLSPEQRKAVGFLTEFTRRMVLMAIPGHRNLASALGLIKEVYRFTDAMIAESLRSGTRLPCKEGCYWCCYLRVKLTPLEVLGIVDYARSRLETGEIAELRQRLVRMDDLTSRTENPHRMGTNRMCPLLADGKCLAYPVRPITCRTYHSLNSSDCEASLVHDEVRLATRRDIFGLSVGLFTGLTEGLRSSGLKTRLLELTAGLRIAIDDPGSGLAEKWLSGDPSFASAELENAEKVENYYRALVEELGKTLR